MSIVSVHGPNTFGSRGAVEAGPVLATVNPANGMIWTFKLDTTTTRVAADFDWTYTPAGGSPASPINDTFSPTITFTGVGAKTVTLTVTGAGAGANPAPPAGTYPITVTTVSGAAPQLLRVGEEEPPPEEDGAYDPGDYTVAEVQEYVDEHPEEAQVILDLEREGKDRSTLVSYLEALLNA